MIRLRPSGVDEILIKRVQDWYEPGPGVFIQSLTASFTPAQLFTGTTTGAWYDPSDTTTLFQNAAGTLPVTAVEQPVGLMLDKSKGLVLGPELFVGLVTGGWTAPSNVVISSDTTYTSLTTTGPIKTGLFTIGKIYRVDYNLTATNGAGIRFQNQDVAGAGTVIATTAAGGSSGTFYINATAGGLFLRSTIASTSDVTINSLSVRELPGNHAFNSSGNSANFPVLSARYNLLEKTEDFSNAYWVKTNTAISANATTAPDGTLTADLFYPLSSGVGRDVYKASSTLACNKIRISAKAGGKIWLTIPDTSGNFVGASFNLSTGQVGTVRSGYTATIEVQPNGFYACTLTASSGVFAYYDLIVADADNSFSVTANGTDGIYIWGADLRVANDALNQPAYQRVNTGAPGVADYDTVGFKPYLRFNDPARGTNNWLQTNSIDFTYGDKMFVCAGVRKLATAPAYMPVLEFSSNSSTNNGGFSLWAPYNQTDTYAFLSKGTASQIPTASGYSSPHTGVLSGIGDISGDLAIIRVNASQAATSTADQGTGNYGNFAMYLGARNGTTLWANIRFYGLVVAGKQASNAEITSTETYLNTKTGAF